MSLAPLASGAHPAYTASDEQHFAIDIPAGPLARSLAALARQTGISIGADGALPATSTPAVRGRLTPRQALEQLLRDSPLEAVAVGPANFRLLLRPRRRATESAATRPAIIAPARSAEADIVVTGTRRAQPLFDAPLSIAVVPGDGTHVGPDGARGTRAVAERVDGLAVTNLGSGRNRLFLRGVADSPFDGYSQSTVSVVLDDGRITFDAPDPDLRLVDIDRVEVLKGPQGPLYGTGALGGVYRIVTNKPDLARFSGSIDVDGSVADNVGGGLEAIVNLPVASDRLALRASGFAQSIAGWIDNTDGRTDSNREHVVGGRIALRWVPAPEWTADAATTVQLLTVDDSQYVAAGPPTYRRANTVAEPHDNDLQIVSAALSGPIGGLRLSLTSSSTWHEVRSTLDASASAALLGVPAPAAFIDDRNYRVEDQEVRLSSPEISAIGWVAGLSRLSSRSDVAGDLAGFGLPSTRVVSLARRVTELAAYGSVSARLGSRWSADLGARLASTATEDERNEPSGAAAHAHRSQRRITPSGALSWMPSPDAALFLRYSQGVRASGVAASAGGAAQPFQADRLESFELGARLRVDAAFTATASLYRARWRDMQSDYLLPNGLIATRNAGNADITGIEASLRWRPSRAWTIEAGATVQRARLVDPAAGAAASDDPRLPMAPDVSARASLGHVVRLGVWRGQAELSGRFEGASRLSFDAGLDRRQPDFAVFSGSAWLAKGPWRIGVSAENLLDARPNTFAFGNPFAVRLQPEATPMAPRRLSLSLRYGLR